VWDWGAAVVVVVGVGVGVVVGVGVGVGVGVVVGVGAWAPSWAMAAATAALTAASMAGLPVGHCWARCPYSPQLVRQCQYKLRDAKHTCSSADRCCVHRRVHHRVRHVHRDRRGDRRHHLSACAISEDTSADVFKQLQPNGRGAKTEG
jgi:hypothetical protein